MRLEWFIENANYREDYDNYHSSSTSLLSTSTGMAMLRLDGFDKRDCKGELFVKLNDIHATVQINLRNDVNDIGNYIYATLTYNRLYLYKRINGVNTTLFYIALNPTLSLTDWFKFSLAVRNLEENGVKKMEYEIMLDDDNGNNIVKAIVLNNYEANLDRAGQMKIGFNYHSNIDDVKFYERVTV